VKFLSYFWQPKVFSAVLQVEETASLANAHSDAVCLALDLLAKEVASMSKMPNWTAMPK
jgi:hypothetical protein